MSYTIPLFLGIYLEVVFLCATGNAGIGVSVFILVLLMLCGDLYWREE